MPERAWRDWPRIRIFFLLLTCDFHITYNLVDAMKWDFLFADEEEKKIVMHSAVISAVITALFAIFVYVYTYFNP